MINFLVFIIVCYLITYSAIPFLSKYIYDAPNERSSHTISKPTGGGLVFAFLISLIAFINNDLIPLICLPLSIIGLIDDKFDLAPFIRLSAQIFTVILLFSISPLNNIILNSYSGLTFLLILFSIIFLSTGCINFINFTDGLDGLLAGCMIIIFGSISIYLDINYWPYVACLLGFIVLNWHPSKIFMGDVGSTFLGSLFVGVILQMGSFTEALKILLLASPLLGDALISVAKRLLSGESIIIPHKSFYFKRLNEGKFSHDQVSMIYMLATFLICLTLLFGSLNWMIFTICFEFVVLLFLEKNFAV
ncbi:hypothetical protein [uncultured Prochlorococcus sp.]|uniref:hypothetical protein n=1 Tax=uncultured Prochlorococcus sp. TaxID=159733 RepID=UPI0025859A7E|nr:hypothetical protein [uncultured Prochlorococcus sp.]